eukprot:TRINITY_DN6082_c0_g1_i1.p1 TRINITY_DN6082_c0_g1~~TRINITY_DN6082_c0_g1_i1.p1  ORF type:complete len:562 (-),score=106.11 TRINITY_DN6082_c0_g1_i1:54-1739(-)
MSLQDTKTTTTTTATTSTPSGRYFCAKCNWSGAKINHAGVCLSCQMNGVKVVLRWQCNTCPKSILWNGKSNHERSASHIATVANPTQSKVGPMRKKSAPKTSSHLISELPPPPSTSSSPVDLSQTMFSQVPVTIHQPPSSYQCSIPETSLLDELFMEDFLGTFELEPQFSLDTILESNINLTSSSEATPTHTSPASPVDLVAPTFTTLELEGQSNLEVLNTEIAHLEARLKTLQYHRQRLLRFGHATRSVEPVTGESQPTLHSTHTSTANTTTTHILSPIEFNLPVFNTVEPLHNIEHDHTDRYTPLPIEFANTTTSTPSSPHLDFATPNIDFSPNTPSTSSPHIEFATSNIDFAENGVASPVEFGSSLFNGYAADQLECGLYEYKNVDTCDSCNNKEYEGLESESLSFDPLERKEAGAIAYKASEGEAFFEYKEAVSIEYKAARSIEYKAADSIEYEEYKNAGTCDSCDNNSPIECKELHHCKDRELCKYKGARSLDCKGRNNSPLECKPRSNNTLTPEDNKERTRLFKNILGSFSGHSIVYINITESSLRNSLLTAVTA